MNRIAILTAGGDTPALNATIYGAVTRANQLKVEVFGLMEGFSSLVEPRLAYVPLNPLYREIPELDPTYGGTILGASREYIDPNQPDVRQRIFARLEKLKIEGLVCVGGDGTLGGMQMLSEGLPTVLAPKTIDNDLGLNDPDETNDWGREACSEPPGYRYVRTCPPRALDIQRMVNYVTPGYATAVFVSAAGVQRIRTTAESHRRIAIVEVMGRHSGWIALGAAYGQPDLVLVPEQPLDAEQLVERVREVYDRQQNVVIVCGEGLVDRSGCLLGARERSTDPAGNVLLSGAADALRQLLVERLGDTFFRQYRRLGAARDAIFTRKVGHTQRGGRPLVFDRFHAAQLGAKAVDLLLDGANNAVATLQWDRSGGFRVDSIAAERLCDRWGTVRPRLMHPDLFDAARMQPSPLGIEYLLPIFTTAIGADDVEHLRQTLFDSGNLFRPYHSLNVDIARRVLRLDE